MSETNDLTRRDVVKLAGTAAAAATTIQTARAATDQVKYGIIGVGGRGQYLLHHLSKVDNGNCVAVCDVDCEHAAHGREAGRRQSEVLYGLPRTCWAIKKSTR